MNKRTKALDKEQYENIIATIRSGFEYNGHIFKPNNRLATMLVVQANIGVRISDIIKLRLDDIVMENGRYHLDIVEQKTGKERNFTVPAALYEFLEKCADKLGCTAIATYSQPQDCFLSVKELYKSS